MKLSKYDRRQKLKAKGIRLLPSSQISKGTSDKGQTQYWFESEKALRAYASTVRIAEKGESLWHHYGYWTDEFQDETLKPVVAIIGQGAFYGYCESCSGGIVLIYDGRADKTYQGSRYNADEARAEQLRDLASSADCMAERAAEKEREYNARWQEARRIEEEIEAKEAGRAAHYEQAREAVTELKELKDNAASVIPIATLFPNTVDRLTESIRTNRYSASTLLFEIVELKTKLSTEFKDVL